MHKKSFLNICFCVETLLVSSLQAFPFPSEKKEKTTFQPEEYSHVERRRDFEQINSKLESRQRELDQGREAGSLAYEEVEKFIVSNFYSDSASSTNFVILCRNNNTMQLSLSSEEPTQESNLELLLALNQTFSSEFEISLEQLGYDLEVLSHSPISLTLLNEMIDQVKAQKSKIEQDSYQGLPVLKESSNQGKSSNRISELEIFERIKKKVIQEKKDPFILQADQLWLDCIKAWGLVNIGHENPITRNRALLLATNFLEQEKQSHSHLSDVVFSQRGDIHWLMNNVIPSHQEKTSYLSRRALCYLEQFLNQRKIEVSISEFQSELESNNEKKKVFAAQFQKLAQDAEQVLEKKEEDNTKELTALLAPPENGDWKRWAGTLFLSLDQPCYKENIDRLAQQLQEDPLTAWEIIRDILETRTATSEKDAKEAFEEAQKKLEQLEEDYLKVKGEADQLRPQWNLLINQKKEISTQLISPLTAWKQENEHLKKELNEQTDKNKIAEAYAQVKEGNQQLNLKFSDYQSVEKQLAEKNFDQNVADIETRELTNLYHYLESEDNILRKIKRIQHRVLLDQSATSNISTKWNELISTLSIKNAIPQKGPSFSPIKHPLEHKLVEDNTDQYNGTLFQTDSKKTDVEKTAVQKKWEQVLAAGNAKEAEETANDLASLLEDNISHDAAQIVRLFTKAIKSSKEDFSKKATNFASKVNKSLEENPDNEHAEVLKGIISNTPLLFEKERLSSIKLAHNRSNNLKPIGGNIQDRFNDAVKSSLARQKARTIEEKNKRVDELASLKNSYTTVLAQIRIKNLEEEKKLKDQEKSLLDNLLNQQRAHRSNQKKVIEEYALELNKDKEELEQLKISLDQEQTQLEKEKDKSSPFYQDRLSHFNTAREVYNYKEALLKSKQTLLETLKKDYSNLRGEMEEFTKLVQQIGSIIDKLSGELAKLQPAKETLKESTDNAKETNRSSEILGLAMNNQKVEETAFEEGNKHGENKTHEFLKQDSKEEKLTELVKGEGKEFRGMEKEICFDSKQDQELQKTRSHSPGLPFSQSSSELDKSSIVPEAEKIVDVSPKIHSGEEMNDPLQDSIAHKLTLSRSRSSSKSDHRQTGEEASYKKEEYVEPEYVESIRQSRSSSLSSGGNDDAVNLSNLDILFRPSNPFMNFPSPKKEAQDHTDPLESKNDRSEHKLELPRSLEELNDESIEKALKGIVEEQKEDDDVKTGDEKYSFATQQPNQQREENEELPLKIRNYLEEQLQPMPSVKELIENPSLIENQIQNIEKLFNTNLNLQHEDKNIKSHDPFKKRLALYCASLKAQIVLMKGALENLKKDIEERFKNEFVSMVEAQLVLAHKCHQIAEKTVSSTKIENLSHSFSLLEKSIEMDEQVHECFKNAIEPRPEHKSYVTECWKKAFEEYQASLKSYIDASDCFLEGELLKGEAMSGAGDAFKESGEYAQQIAKAAELYFEQVNPNDEKSVEEHVATCKERVKLEGKYFFLCHELGLACRNNNLEDIATYKKLKEKLNRSELLRKKAESYKTNRDILEWAHAFSSGWTQIQEGYLTSDRWNDAAFSVLERATNFLYPALNSDYFKVLEYWKQSIENHLKPIAEEGEYYDRIASQLKDLLNKNKNTQLLYNSYSSNLSKAEKGKDRRFCWEKALNYATQIIPLNKQLLNSFAEQVEKQLSNELIQRKEALSAFEASKRDIIEKIFPLSSKMLDYANAADYFEKAFLLKEKYQNQSKSHDCDQSIECWEKAGKKLRNLLEAEENGTLKITQQEADEEVLTDKKRIFYYKQAAEWFSLAHDLLPKDPHDTKNKDASMHWREGAKRAKQFAEITTSGPGMAVNAKFFEKSIKTWESLGNFLKELRPIKKKNFIKKVLSRSNKEEFLESAKNYYKDFSDIWYELAINPKKAVAINEEDIDIPFEYGKKNFFILKDLTFLSSEKASYLKNDKKLPQFRSMLIGYGLDLAKFWIQVSKQRCASQSDSSRFFHRRDGKYASCSLGTLKAREEQAQESLNQNIDNFNRLMNYSLALENASQVTSIIQRVFSNYQFFANRGNHFSSPQFQEEASNSQIERLRRDLAKTKELIEQCIRFN